MKKTCDDQGHSFKPELVLRNRKYFIIFCAILIAYIGFFSIKNVIIVQNPEVKPTEPLQCKESKVPIIDPYDVKEFSQTDPKLLNYLRGRHLTPPSKLPYKFNEARYVAGGSAKDFERLKKIFNNKKGGFFIEVGAFDGVGSNTLFFEKDFNWNGLLIECHPILLPELKRAHRKAYIADVCISSTDRPAMTEFISAKGDSNFGKFPGSSSLRDDNFFKKMNTPTQKFEVPTVPLYSILAALEINAVDLVVLDVQGIELKVLKNFPFTSVSVKVWLVEHSEHTAEEKIEMIEIMAKNGYKNQHDNGGDYLFVHNSM